MATKDITAASNGIGLVEMFFQVMKEGQGRSDCNQLPEGCKLRSVEMPKPAYKAQAPGFAKQEHSR